jgi:molybdate transport system ATP-binding protein
VRALEVSLQKQWPGFSLDVAFRAEGGATVLFGPSGSGKTLIVKAVAGLGRPDHGCIALGERVLLDTKAGTNLPPEERRVGVVFQEPRLFPHMSVERNLLYGWRLLARNVRPEVDRIIALLGLDHLLKRRPNRLSGGEKQRVAIGRALLAAPELLIMDEPLANLDQARKDEILPFLARLKSEARIPILYVTHARAEADVLADRIVHISDGAILEIEER